jgi:AraC-like DNA-binding protein
MRVSCFQRGIIERNSLIPVVLFIEYLFMGAPNKIVLYNEEVIRLDGIRTFIEQNYSQALNIQKISEKFTIDKSTLQRHFYYCYGEPIAHYIRKCRMTRAMILLKERSIPVSQIGMTVGYSHRAPFNRAFRKFFGYPPKYFLTTVHEDNLKQKGT